MNPSDRTAGPTTNETLLPPPGAIPPTLQLHPPRSPAPHRTLRRLQSAHSLGAKAAAAAHAHAHAQSSSPVPQPRLQLQHQQQQLQHLHLLPHQPTPTPPSPEPPRRHASVSRSPQRGRANSDAPPPVPPQLSAASVAMMTVSAAASRRSALSKRSLAADAMSLERLLREGPPDGDVEGALESARLKILDQGIKSDSDGMVSKAARRPLPTSLPPLPSPPPRFSCGVGGVKYRKKKTKEKEKEKKTASR